MSYKAAKQNIVREITETLDRISSKDVEQLIKKIEKAERVFFVGVGRVLLALEGMAKRLGHLGIQTVDVGQITEPAITDKDLLIVGSGSGESAFLLTIAKKSKGIWVPSCPYRIKPRQHNERIFRSFYSYTRTNKISVTRGNFFYTAND